MKSIPIAKLLLSASACFLMALACVGVSVFAAPGADDESLIVGVPANRCPIFYQDAATKDITGIGVDLMRTAADAAGYSASFVFIEEETLKDALDNPAYDVILPFGSAISSTSGHASVVSDNLIQTPFTIVSTDSKELPPLEYLRVGMLSSLAGGAETVHELFPGVKINLYDTMDDCVKALRSGHVDALLHNSYVWSYVLQKPSYSNLVVQPATVFSMDFRAGTLDTPEGRAMIERLNGGIAKITDTHRQAVILDHTSRRLYQYTFWDYLYQYGWIVLLVVLIFGGLLVITILKHRSNRLAQEKKMQELIDYDSLTGAYSLDGFRKRVRELMLANPNTPYFLSYNNVKNFKFINDSLGRDNGDDLLRFWVKKSLDLLSDDEAIGRVGSDHFAVLRRVEGESVIIDDERFVLEPARNFFIDRGKELRVQICSGIYVLTEEDFKDIDVDHMLDLARVAEKRVRDTSQDGYEFYNPSQWEKGKLVADVVGHFPVAVLHDELHVWYQPQVNYETGKVIGTEALCRWDHASQGWLKPGEFITTLEDAGLIYRLDRFVWDKVCRDLQRWNAEGKHRCISVNMSRCDIRDHHNVPEQFYDLTQKYGLTPDQLRIEIMESAFVEEPELLIRTTEKLHALGFQVEMDDFGSGYSSLNMLKEVPVDRIKLDLNFLTETGNPEKGHIIVSNVIRMINDLGIKVLAEGVETAEQAEFLRSQGCFEMQGFYFYQPMTSEEYEKLVETIELE